MDLGESFAGLCEAPYYCRMGNRLPTSELPRETVYHGCQMVLRATVGDHFGRLFHGEVVFSIVPSDVQMGLIRAGTGDGKGWYTKGAGKNQIGRAHV